MSQTIEMISPRPRKVSVADTDKIVEIYSYRFRAMYWDWIENDMTGNAKDRGVGLYVSSVPGKSDGAVPVFYGDRAAYARDGYRGHFDRQDELGAGRLRWWNGKLQFFPDPVSPIIAAAIA
jgi:hypothetical protein